MKADVAMNLEQCDRAFKAYLITLETMHMKGLVYRPKIEGYILVSSQVERMKDDK
tara:strand:- start:486 stop:650 length:165 start_codon:yes stop_codon:yes gene_type:complete